MQRLEEILAALMARDNIWARTPTLGCAQPRKHKVKGARTKSRGTVEGARSIREGNGHGASCSSWDGNDANGKAWPSAHDMSFSHSHSDEQLGFITRTNQKAPPRPARRASLMDSQSQRGDRPGPIVVDGDDDREVRRAGSSDAPVLDLDIPIRPKARTPAKDGRSVIERMQDVLNRYVAPALLPRECDRPAP
jgi:hypothetical protein